MDKLSKSWLKKAKFLIQKSCETKTIHLAKLTETVGAINNMSFKLTSHAMQMSMVTPSGHEMNPQNPYLFPFTLLIFKNPFHLLLKRSYSRRKVSSYIFTSIGSCLAYVGLSTLPLTQRPGFFFFFFLVILEDGKGETSSAVIQILDQL